MIHLFEILNFRLSFYCQRKYDLIIGGVRPEYFTYSTKFVASAPYLQDDLTWCVSQSKAISRWKNIFYIPKDFLTYFWGVTMYIATIFGTFLLTTFEEKPLDIFYCAILSVQTLTGFTSQFSPKLTVTRFHFGQFLIIPFWLNQIFNGFLITYLHLILYEDQIKTLDEISRNNFHLAGDHLVFEHLEVKNMVRDLVMI